jgi:hypothetical protein
MTRVVGYVVYGDGVERKLVEQSTIVTWRSAATGASRRTLRVATCAHELERLFRIDRADHAVRLKQTVLGNSTSIRCASEWRGSSLIGARAYRAGRKSESKEREQPAYFARIVTVAVPTLLLSKPETSLTKKNSWPALFAHSVDFSATGKHWSRCLSTQVAN